MEMFLYLAGWGVLCIAVGILFYVAGMGESQ